MINEIYGLKPLKEMTIIQGKAEVSSISVNSESFISRLQAGDKIEGTLVQEENHIVLKLDNGIKLSINLLENVELGQLFLFDVVSKEGNKLVLKPHLTDMPPHKALTDKVIDEFKLPNQAVMKHIVAQFISKGLSLDKESLLSVFQNHKTYEVPTEILVNLKSNEMPIGIEDLSQWSRLKSEGIQMLLEGFQSIIAEIAESNLLERLLHSLLNKVCEGNLEKAMKGILFNKIEGIENVTYDIIDTTLKEWVVSSFAEDQLCDQLGNVINRKMEISYIEFLQELIEDIVKTSLEVDIKKLNEEPKESKKIINTSRQLEELINEFEKLNLSNEGRGKLQQIHQTFQLIQKYNIEAEYFYFPFVLNEQQGNGELYFFKPHKKHGFINDRMYIVMALDMPTLRKVEVHIEHIQNGIHMTLKVEQQSVKELIEGVLGILYDELKDLGYEISQLRVSLLKSRENEEKVDIQLRHMDLKI